MPTVDRLARFVEAQSPVLQQVQAELHAGRKRTHWMWYVFPQLAGLGHSAMAQRYALASLAEARDYLAHSVLGKRLVDCTSLVNAVQARTAHDIFGSPDDVKFRSCLTLFQRAGGNPVFAEALTRYFNNEEDPRTVALLERNE